MNYKQPTVAISGGFDPVHSGHIRMVLEASKYGNVIVILNSDEWLTRKKGYVFMSFEDRKEIMMALKGVTVVSHVDDSDETVCEALRRLRPDYFANGGDRKSDNVPEVKVCQELGITTIWNIGGEKTQSSSELVARKR